MPKKPITPAPVKVAEFVRPVRLELRYRMDETSGNALPYEIIATAQELDQNDEILTARSQRFIVDDTDPDAIVMTPAVKAAMTALSNFALDQWAAQSEHTLA